MLARRLDYLYASFDVALQDDDPLYPFKPSQIDAVTLFRARDAIAKFREYHEACIAAGAIVPSGVEHRRPTPRVVPVMPDLDRAWNDALVQVAEHDPIRDDGLRYTDALRAAGVPVRSTEYVGMPHGFMSFPRLCRSAPQALAELCSEMRAALN